MDEKYRDFHFTHKEAIYLENADIIIAKCRGKMDELPYIDSERYMRDLETVYVRSAAITYKDINTLIEELDKKNKIFNDFRNGTKS